MQASSLPVNFAKFLRTPFITEHLQRLLLALEEAKVIESTIDGEDLIHYRVDIIWWYLAHLQINGTSLTRFKYLPKIAEIVFAIPHTDPELGRLFSIVRKNKTDNRSSLEPDDTLSSILAIKINFLKTKIPSHKWQPNEELLSKTKHTP